MASFVVVVVAAQSLLRAGRELRATLDTLRALRGTKQKLTDWRREAPIRPVVFEDAGLEPTFYTHRERSFDETLPWDHIDIGVKKEYLIEDYLWSLEGRTRIDCREHCFACGILPKYADLRRMNPGDTWKCPEVGSPQRSDMHVSASA